MPQEIFNDRENFYHEKCEQKYRFLEITRFNQIQKEYQAIESYTIIVQIWGLSL